MKQLMFAALFGVFLLTTSVFSVPDIVDCTKNGRLTCTITWVIEEKGCNLDNCTKNGFRNIISVHHPSLNATCKVFPAPTIYAQPNQRIQVQVINRLHEPTTIHWHGMLMKRTMFSDGVPAITQCPIQARTTFVYDFYANSVPGTHWYHSHYKPQRMDGLYGLIIIKETDPSYENLPEETVLISDWYHHKAEEMLHAYNASNFLVTNGTPAGMMYEPVPHAALVNDVIEVEGELVTSTKKVNRVPIHVGQRYSVIPYRQPDAENITEFWMRMEANPDCLRRNTPESYKNEFLKESRSIISYNPYYKYAPGKEPTTQRWDDKKMECIDLDLSFLSPKNKSLLPPKDAKITTYGLQINMFTSRQYLGTDDFKDYFGLTTYGTVTGLQRMGIYHAYNDSFNTLERVYDRYQHGKTGLKPAWPSSQNVIILNERGRMIEVVLRNIDDIAHPFHLHGHFFWVMETTQFNYSSKKVTTFKYDEPIMRDTATVSQRGTTTIRFMTDNPGVWAFHCHIEWHVEVGMMAQFLELPDEIKGIPKQSSQINGSKIWENLCIKP
ncbi:19949_t:CDS:2 [Racocetra persica]|uniref:19949_t:CDS:1 n=1 Tax=Racocetra persica TaxID=160502 RepID=A0ACA9K8H9_9GLOM|nr:19949_t:CDS:2 [Racocetra persica]